jgi:hypothetical protein
LVIISRYCATTPPTAASPARAPPLDEVAGGGRGVAREVVAVAIERVARDVEAERLLLERQELLGRPRLDLGIGLALGRGAGRRRRRGDQAEQRGLAALAVALLAGALLERGVERGQELRAVAVAGSARRTRRS